MPSMTPEQLAVFLSQPIIDPPPGETVNLENPEDLVVDFIILCTVGAVVTGAAVAMRLYTRWTLTRKLILEDGVLLAGWIMFVAGINTPIYQAMRYKLGVHQWNLRGRDFVQYLKLFHYGTLLFCVSMLLLRIAIIMQVVRHFVPKGGRNFTFWASHLLIVLNIIFWMAITFMEVFSCKPMNKIWDFYLPGKCLDRHSYLIATSTMNLVSEILIMILPQRIIWSLNLSTKQKLELTPLFLVGTFTCICSAVRLWQTVIQWPTDDLTFYIADAVMLWTVPEVACSVLVPCLPSLPQFIRIVQRRKGPRPASTVFQLPHAMSPARRTTKSWSGHGGHPKPARTLVSDVEYHELVMRTETTVDIVEREETGPWVQTPATVHITGGRGPTKVFQTPTYFRNDVSRAKAPK